MSCLAGETVGFLFDGNALGNTDFACQKIGLAQASAVHIGIPLQGKFLLG